MKAIDLGKRFETGWVFRHVEFEVRPGERLAVIGKNGAGKSTLLRLLAGLLAPSEGRVVRPPGDVRTTVGYAGLELALYAHLSGREHLRLAGALRGRPPREGEWMARVGLEAAGDRPVGAYSTGMKARLRLALALQTNPEILLLDEPSAALDEEGRQLVETTIETYPGAVVFATNHPPDLAWATHALNLDE